MSSPIKGTYKSFEVGQVIADRYEISRTLGAGGMGAVFQVIDRTLDGEVVAMKILYPHLTDDEITLARFRNEVLIARKLSHPNIIKIFDFGQDKSGAAFITMEFIDGLNLSRKIYAPSHARLSFEESLRIIRDIARGMEHAHMCGVIHRDLKPDNVLISAGGHVCVTDLGLARTLDVDKGFTHTGEAVGTPYYMSPEQLRGDNIDTRADIYALGIISYEIVVGQRPFQDESYLTLAAMHLKQDIPAFADKENGIPNWFQEFVFACGEKDPDDRFQSMGEVLDYLENNSSQLHNITINSKAVRMRYSATIPVVNRKKRKQRKRLAVLSMLILVCGLLPLGTAKVLRASKSLHIVASQYLLRMEESIGFEISPLRAVVGTQIKYSPQTLMKSIKEGDLTTLSILLGAGMDPNVLGKDKKPVMIESIESGQEDVASMLINYGGNLDWTDEKGQSPLIYALKNKRYTVVKSMIDAGADLDRLSKDGNNAVSVSVNLGDSGLVAMLLNSGASQNIKDEKGRTPLMNAVARGDIQTAQVLLSAPKGAGGILVNEGDELGITPLMLAAKKRNVQLVNLLVEKGADFKLADKAGRKTIEYASGSFRKQLRQIENRYRRAALPKLQSGNSQAANTKQNDAPTTLLTRLRKVGKPKIRIVRGGSYPLGLRYIQVRIKNYGEETANTIKAYAVIPDGQKLALRGPIALKRKLDGMFVWTAREHGGDLDLSSIPNFNTKKIKIEFTCENCRD